MLGTEIVRICSRNWLLKAHFIDVLGADEVQAAVNSSRRNCFWIANTDITTAIGKGNYKLLVKNCIIAETHSYRLQDFQSTKPKHIF